MSLIPYSFWGGVNPYTFSTGLKGARFVGYFADDPYWFNTATPHGDVDNNRTNINNFTSNADLYSWVWYGYFLAPTTGTYTFYTASDDASYLWIGNNALNSNYAIANALVNNGGLHGVVEQSGTITLQANTFYALRIQFGENGGGDSMTVSFSGPGITKTTNGAGYYFGGQETYPSNYIAGSFPQEVEESGGGSGGIVTDQLILHLDAGNTASYPTSGSTWTDLKGNSNATLFNSPAFNSGNGGHIQFRVTGSTYADLNLVGVNSSTPLLTVEMWVRPIDMGVISGMPFGFTVYNLYQINDGLGFNTAVNDVRGIYESRAINEDGWYGQWQHIVVVMNQTTSYSNNKMYFNGKLYDTIEQIIGTEDTGNRTFSTGQMRISGWRNNTSYPVNQDLAIFRVYNKELSEAEVAQNYNAERVRFGKKAVKPHVQLNCRMYFDFEGENDWYSVSGDYVRDFSRRFQRGQLFGGAAGWGSEYGGIMKFRAGSSRYVSTNRASNDFGLYYGSSSFVMMVRSINMDIFDYIFGRDSAAPTSQADVNIAFNGHGVRYSHNEPSAGVQTFSTGPMAHNVWYHVVMTYNFNTYVVQIYVNGELVVSNGFQERMIGLGNYNIAKVNTTTYDFDMGLMMIYNRIISQSEVTENFNYQKTRFGITNNGIVRSNNILWWDAGNTFSYPGTGTAITDLLNYDYAGTINGATYNSGNGGKWIFVKTENDRINTSNTTGSPISVGSSNFTIECWAKPANETVLSYFITNRNLSTGDGFTLTLGTPNVNNNITQSRKVGILFVQNSASFGRGVHTVNDIIDGNWKHIVATRNGSTFRIYINGVEETTQTPYTLGSGTITLNSGQHWSFGALNTGQEGANADLSVIRLYNKELTSTEVLQNYNEEKSRFGL
jgi:hypothetical protein